SLQEFDKLGTASLITRTTNDTNQVQMVAILILNMMVSAPLMAIGGVVLAIGQDATLSWILVVIMPIVVVSIFLIMGQAILLFQKVQTKIDKLNLILDEGLTGVRVIRAFDRIQHEEKRFDEANLDLTQLSIKVNRVVSLMWPILMLVMNLSS